MDTLTHALSGALIARATAGRGAAPRSVPRRVAAGFFACAAPDLDFVIGFFGPVEYLLNHRGVTHSMLLAPLWALPLAWLLAKMLREPGGWRALYGVCLLGILAHIAGDLITSFGTMVLAPLSDWRAALGTTFIIDLWFSGIIIAGLVASALLRRTRVPALAACGLLVAYVGFQAVLRAQAVEFGQRYAAARGFSGAQVQVNPRAVTPFNWTIYVSDARAHHYAHVNLLREAPREPRPDDGFLARLDRAFRPLDQARWEARPRFGDDARGEALGRAAWQAPELAFFRWFAALPAFDGRSAGSECVWFVDLRFVNPGRDWVPFRFGACREREGAPWRAYQREALPGSAPAPLVPTPVAAAPAAALQAARPSRLQISQVSAD